MAITNTDGKILIDDEAANRDIAELRQIREKLEDTLTHFMNVQAENYGQLGPTAESIEDFSSRVILALKKQIAGIDSTIEFISATVTMYQTIDAESAEMINTTL